MNYFDLHCDTPHVIYKNGAKFKDGNTAVSLEKGEIFDRFWRRRAQSYTNTTRTNLPKDAERAPFAAGLYYSCLATMTVTQEFSRMPSATDGMRFGGDTLFHAAL